MSRRRFTVVIIVVLAAAVAAVASSRNDNRTAILGQWEYEDGTVIQFTPDGTYTTSVNGIEISGSYRWIDARSIRFEHPYVTETWRVDIRGDEMILSHEEGVTTRVTRIKK